MEIYKDVANLLRSACHEIRNAASRDSDLRVKVLAVSGVEEKVRDAMKRFPVQCDGAGYDALRDLDLSFVHYINTKRSHTINLPLSKTPS